MTASEVMEMTRRVTGGRQVFEHQGPAVDRRPEEPLTRKDILVLTGMTVRQINDLITIRGEVDKGNQVAITAVKSLDRGTITFHKARTLVDESRGGVKPKPMSRKNHKLLADITGLSHGLTSIRVDLMDPGNAKMWHGELGQALTNIKKLRASMKEKYDAD